MSLRRDPLAFFLGLAKEHGDFVRYQLPLSEAYFVNDPALIHETFIKEGARFTRWSFYPDWARVIGQDGIFNSGGKVHQRMRQLVRPAFQRNRLPDYAAQMVDSTQHLMDRWQNGAVVDVRHEMVLLTLDIAARTLFGVRLGERLEHLYSATHKALEHKARSLDQQYERLERLYSGSRPARRPANQPGGDFTDEHFVTEAINEMGEVSRFILAERRRTGQSDDDLLALLLLGQDQIPESYSDQQIEGEIRNYLLAAHITTASVLTAVWWHLAKEPALLATLQKSINEVLAGRPPTLQDVPALKCCEHVLLEALRLYPPFWFLGREALEEVSVRGRLLPAKTKIATVPWVLHRNEERFPEPERFLPARWEDDMRARLPRGAFMPFSAGIRGCLGEHFAMLEGVLTMAHVAREWELQTIPGQPDPGWVPQTVLWPQNGVRLRAVRRSA